MSQDSEQETKKKRFWTDEYDDLRWPRIGIFVGIFVGLLVIVLIVFHMTFKFVDYNEVGYRYNGLTGQITVLPRTGWFRIMPIRDSIGTIDRRPMQVCINANNRVLNCKLVQFNPAGIETFLNWHGRNWSSSTNTSSSGAGASTALAEILKSYAYDGTGRSYPFLTVLRDLRPAEVVGSGTAVVSTPPQTPVTAAPVAPSPTQ